VEKCFTCGEVGGRITARTDRIVDGTAEDGRELAYLVARPATHDLCGGPVVSNASTYLGRSRDESLSDVSKSGGAAEWSRAKSETLSKSSGAAESLKGDLLEKIV